MAARKAARVRNRRGEGARLRDEIIDAGARLVDATASAEMVTLRAVAREAGISPMSIYSHFADREAIVAAVVDKTSAELAAAVTAGDGESTDSVGRLLARCAAYLAFARERPRRYALVSNPPAAPSTGQPSAPTVAAIVSAIRDCVTAGRSDSTDPFADATAVWIALHGYAALHATHPDFPWPQDQQAMVDHLVLQLARVTREEGTRSR